MQAHRIGAAVAAICFASIVVAAPAPGQPAPAAPIRSIDDFYRSLHEAWHAWRYGQSLERTEQTIDAALVWSRANPGTTHTELIQALFEDGQIATLSQHPDKAETLFREALANLDANRPPDQVMIYQVLKRILALSWLRGRGPEAVDIANRLSRLSADQFQRDIVRYLGAPDRLSPGQVDVGQRLAQEPEQRALLAFRDDLDRIIATLIGVPGAAPEVAEAVMTRTAVIQDAVTGLHLALSEQENRPPAIPDALASYFHAFPRDPAGGRLAPIDRLRANAAAMGLLAYADPHITPDRLPRPLQLQHERTTLERQIASADPANWKAVSLEEVRQALPDDAIVVQYAVYSRPATARVAAGERRYLRVALPPKGVLDVADIGAVTEINGLVGAACRAILRSIEEGTHCSVQQSAGGAATIKGTGQTLYNVLLAGMGPALTGAAHIIISPDGALNFLPFEMLVDADGKYLISTHQVSYVQSPREIPQWTKAAPVSHGPPLILADPDYDAGGPPLPDDCSDTTRGGRRKLRAAEDLAGFPRLCGAADEARFVLEALPGARVLTRGEATAEAVKAVFGPRILHLATHGFAAVKLAWPQNWFDPQYQLWWDAQDYEVMESDAMLRGGLVFAGANIRRSPGGHSVGMLSAREANLLDLNGTQLVVLSACDSGLGLARSGDGVIGLRRAFALAGARAQTFSLWPAGDKTAAEFMHRYYALLAENRRNVDALAQVKREFLSRGAPWNEPWVWAAFVGYGYPGALGK